MDKVKQSIDLIRQYAPYADKFGGYKVAFSGGKDSQVMLDLFRRAGVRYAAHYSVTTNDPPENVYFIKKNYTEVEFILPRLNFYQLILKKKALPTRKMRFCCSYFKEGTDTGFVAVGVRREESAKRAKYPKFHALLIKTIQRLLDNGYFHNYQPLTPEDVFEWWASKEPASRFFNQLKLDLQ